MRYNTIQQISFFFMLLLRDIDQTGSILLKVDLNLLDSYGSREVALHHNGFIRTCFYIQPLIVRWEAASLGIKGRI